MFGVDPGVSQKSLNMVGNDVERKDVEVPVLSGDRVGSTLRADPLTVDGAAVLASPERRPPAMAPGKIGAEDENR